MDKWVVNHFTQNNPMGPGQENVTALLRRIADSIDELGEVDVQDICFHREITEEEDVVSMTVYYHRDDDPPNLSILRPAD